MGGGRILNVTRKPAHCPKCGKESQVWPIIYGTGDMTESEFLMEYHKSAIMGGDNVPRRAPIWGCSICCTRFRKVNPDGTDADVKLTFLKDVRKDSLDKFLFESSLVADAHQKGLPVYRYDVAIETECREKETLHVYAISDDDAENLATRMVAEGGIGLKGRVCKRLTLELK